MPKLFETNIYQSTDALPTNVDDDVVFTGEQYFMYEEFQLDDNFKTYLRERMQSEQVLRVGIKPTLYQKLFEILHGTEPRVVDFTGQISNSLFSLSR